MVSSIVSKYMLLFQESITVNMDKTQHCIYTLRSIKFYNMGSRERGERGRGGESEEEVWVLGIRQVKMIKCTNLSQIHNKFLP